MTNVKTKLLPLIIMAFSMSLVALGVYVPPVPVPIPYVTKAYIVAMNLSHSALPLTYIEALKYSNPLTYSELISEENVTAPWVGIANLSLSLIIANATPTPYPVILESTALSNSVGGVRWVINLTYPANINPLLFNAEWFILVVAHINGFNYTLYTFRTGYEYLSYVLGNLTMIGGYLTMVNGQRYYLWHHYLYNGSLLYVVPLPGVVTFYAWFGNDLSIHQRVMPLPTSINNQGEFPAYLRYFTAELKQYYNATVVYGQLTGVNYALGNETNYGYLIFNIPRLAPLGPLTYYAPIMLYPNGSLINPTCLPVHYVLSVTFLFENPAYGSFIPMTLFSESSNATGLMVVNGSLIIGGFLMSYDFYNLTTVPVTPLSSLLTQGVNYTGCSIQIYDPLNLGKPLGANAGPSSFTVFYAPIKAWLLKILRTILVI